MVTAEKGVQILSRLDNHKLQDPGDDFRFNVMPHGMAINARRIRYGGKVAAKRALGCSSLTSTIYFLWREFDIAAGLLIWSYRVIANIGKKIIDFTPTRGFAAEAAVTIASRFGISTSTTHTLEGTVMGVGFARGKSDALVERIAKEVFFERLGQAIDVAPVIAFLASDGGWVNAQVIWVNGGNP
ncbi:hypothetical protein SUGI_0488710 [Cryptomeria japonica]|nr:hypothetical protein SUGI_0488710 [Cryptomeria japonica]